MYGPGTDLERPRAACQTSRVSGDLEYTVVLDQPGGETTHNYTRPVLSLPIREGELIHLGGRLDVIVTAIEIEAERGRKVGLLRARLMEPLRA
jgi:hypothetical protein